MRLWIKCLTLMGMILLISCRPNKGEGQIDFVGGDYAYVARDHQLHVVEIAKADKPRWVATIDVPGRIKKVEVKGDYVYVVHYPSVDSWIGNPPDGGIQIIDITNPRRPKIAGYYHSSGLAQDIEVLGDVAYLADWESLRVINVSDPTNPVEMSKFSEGKNAVIKSGNYLYSTWGNCSFRTGYCSGGLSIADVSSPAKPVELGIYNTPELPGYGIVSQEEFVFAVGKGVWQVNVTDKTNPVLESHYELLGEGIYDGDLAVSGDNIYLVTSKGLEILSFEKPGAIVELATMPMTAYVSDITVRGDYVYTVSNEGLHIINVKEPANPYVIGYYSGVH